MPGCTTRCDSKRGAAGGIAPVQSNIAASSRDGTFRSATPRAQTSRARLRSSSEDSSLRSPLHRRRARTRNTLISPNPLSHRSVPSPPPKPASETASSLPPATRICRFDLSPVKKCHDRERTNFRFSTLAYQLSKHTSSGLNSR